MTTRPFNTGAPIGYFITWTTYGTWLPGDARGWNRKGKLENLPSDPLFIEASEGHMKERPFLMSESDRQVVENTIRDHCKIRNWELHAVNARSNHIHVVVSASDYDPKSVVSQFKSWSTRKLQPHHPQRKRFWTEGASRRWINQDDDLIAAVEYTLEAQERKGIE